MSADATRIPEHHRSLFETRSLVGAIVVLAVLGFFGFGLEAIDGALHQQAALVAGAPRAVSPSLSFTPAAGWEIVADETDEGILTAQKNGVTVKISAGAIPAGQKLEDFAAVFHDSDAQGDQYTKVDDPEPFTTTSGTQGVTWEAHGSTQASAHWFAADGTDLAQLEAFGPDSSWSAIEPDLEAMAASMTLTTATPTQAGGS